MWSVHAIHIVTVSYHWLYLKGFCNCQKPCCFFFSCLLWVGHVYFFLCKTFVYFLIFSNTPKKCFYLAAKFCICICTNPLQTFSVADESSWCYKLKYVHLRCQKSAFNRNQEIQMNICPYLQETKSSVNNLDKIFIHKFMHDFMSKAGSISSIYKRNTVSVWIIFNQWGKWFCKAHVRMNIQLAWSPHRTAVFWSYCSSPQTFPKYWHWIVLFPQAKM